MIDDPLEALKPILLLEKSHQDSPPYMWTIYLPLYWKDRVVYEKSGLNQWNAWWRKRDMSEVYIPIPMEIHHNFAWFFPNRDTPFVLQLPNGNTMKAKICQDWWKALMSYSNKELWQWLLRDVLHLREWELLTSEKLDILWVDSVRIDKIDDEHFTINFSKVWSYEIFKDNNFS